MRVFFLSWILAITAQLHAAEGGLTRLPNDTLMYKNSGCFSFRTILNYLPSDYIVDPQLSDKNDMIFCGNANFTNRDIITMVKNDFSSLIKNCAHVQVDESLKKVTVTAKSGSNMRLAEVTKNFYYMVDGKVVVMKAGAAAVLLCVSDLESVKPPFDELLKNSSGI